MAKVKWVQARRDSSIYTGRVTISSRHLKVGSEALMKTDEEEAEFNPEKIKRRVKDDQ